MTTVLITGAGGVATPGLIRRLCQQYDFRIIAVDMDPHAIGLYWAHKGYMVPPGDSPDFPLVMRRICEQEQVDVVVPLVDEELLPALELESYGFKVLLPRREFVRTCLNKLVLTRELAAVGVPVPSTRLASDLSRTLHFPAIVKPIVGHGSRGVGIAYSAKDLVGIFYTSALLDNLIVQSYIEGTEFTVSVVVDRSGRIHAVVPKEIVCKKDVTRIAITRHNDKIDAVCHKIQNSLNADGPFNVQLVMDKNTGLPTVFEINPRFSTTTSLTTAAGIDEVGWLIQRALDPTCPELPDMWKEGVVLLRRTLDEFVDEEFMRGRTPVNLTGEDAVC